MKFIIDGKPYEMDSDFLVDAWYRVTLPYIDPAGAHAKKFADIRLAAKALLRVRLGFILKIFADIFHVDDWHTLAPTRGEDVLVKLHGYLYLALLMRAEGQHIILELESGKESGKESSHDCAGIVGTNAGDSLTLTRAYFDGGQEIYSIKRPDTGGQVGNGIGQTLALASASASSSGLVADEDAAEI